MKQEWSKEQMKQVDAFMKKLENAPSVSLICNVCKKVQSLQPLIFKESKMTLQNHMESTTCEYCGTKGKMSRFIK